MMLPVACLVCVKNPQQQQEAQPQQQQSDADNIKVVARLRPLFPAELTKSATNVCQVSEDFSSLKVSRLGR